MHGIRATYVKGCRCEDCRLANRTYQSKLNRRNAAIAWGTVEPDLIDSSEVRAHIAILRASGVGRRQIAAASGVSQTVIMRLIGLNTDRPANRIRRSTAAKILAVQPGQVAPGGMVPSLGTRRRIQALIRIGWSQYALAEKLGTTNAHIGLLLRRQERVLGRTADQVKDLYHQLELTPGPSNRARLYAARRDWLPPLAWNDPDTDLHPVTTSDKDIIDEVKIDLVRAGEVHKLTRAERHHAIISWHRQDVTWYEIDKLLGLTRGSSQKHFHRYQKDTEKFAQNATVVS